MARLDSWSLLDNYCMLFDGHNIAQRLAFDLVLRLLMMR